jgi:MFS family permease
LGALGLTLGLAVAQGSQFAAQASFLTALFPVNVRFTGIAISRELTSALLAGPAPAVAAILVAYDNGGWHYLAMAMATCSIVTIIALLYAKHLPAPADPSST